VLADWSYGDIVLTHGMMSLPLFLCLDRDSTAAACAKAVRVQLAELEAQQAEMDAEIKAEQEVQNKLAGLRCGAMVEDPQGCTGAA
jgi:hypothetical protein